MGQLASSELASVSEDDAERRWSLLGLSTTRGAEPVRQAPRHDGPSGGRESDAACRSLSVSSSSSSCTSPTRSRSRSRSPAPTLPVAARSTGSKDTSGFAGRSGESLTQERSPAARWWERAGCDVCASNPSTPSSSDVEDGEVPKRIRAAFTITLSEEPTDHYGGISATTVTIKDGLREACGKAALIAAFGLVLALFLQHPPGWLTQYFKEERLKMTRTTAEYPESFSALHEYDPSCDTHSTEFQFGNRAELEERGNFHFIQYFSWAGVFNMGCDLLKAFSAVLMQPVALIPNADEFQVDEVHRADLSLRRSPTNYFVTLGSLVPPPDILWEGGPNAWNHKFDAQELIALVHRHLPDGKRAVGAEFSPLESVQQLMSGPMYVHQRTKFIMLPWSLQNARMFFPIQFTQLVWELFAESFTREPTPLGIVLDPPRWAAWIRISFRHEVLLPVLLRLLRGYISVDNLRSFLRGDPAQEAFGLRLALTILLTLVALPQLLIFTPAIVVTLAVAFLPTLAVCYLFGSLTGSTYWQQPYHKNMPSVQFAFPCILVSAFLVSESLHWWSRETYICTHSKALLVPIHAGKLSVDAPMLFFLFSMLCCAAAVLVPIWMLRGTARSCSLLAYLVNPEYIYMQWLKSPLYDTRALRIGEHAYQTHKTRHFFANKPDDSCAYCAHVGREKEAARSRARTPVQAVIFTGQGLPWEPPCLDWFVAQAQRGEACAAELRLAVDAMRKNKQPEDFARTLMEASLFAEGLQHAEVLRQRLAAPCGYATPEAGFAVDGSRESRRTIRAINYFLRRNGEELRRGSLPDGASPACSPRKAHDSALGRLTAEAMQRYLKKEGFYSDSTDGIFGPLSTRSLQAWLAHEGFSHELWLRDEHGFWGPSTTIALQRFLKQALAGGRWKADVVDGRFEPNCVRALQQFLRDQGEAVGHFSGWRSKAKRGMHRFLLRRGYGAPLGRLGQYQHPDDEEFSPVTDNGAESCAEHCGYVFALQEWLRDEGFPAGFSGKGQDGVDGLWAPTTSMALQMYLNSDRSDRSATKQALRVDGKMNTKLVARLQEFLGMPPDGSWDVSLVRNLQAFLSERGYYAGALDGVWEIPSPTIAGLQGWLRKQGLQVDDAEGVWAPSTIGALERFLNCAKAAPIPAPKSLLADGNFDAETVTEVQRFLLRSGENPGTVDGEWGPRCKQAMQKFLAKRGFFHGAADGRWDHDESHGSSAALEHWLAAEGFYHRSRALRKGRRNFPTSPTVKSTDSCSDTEEAVWDIAVTRALQRFLNADQSQLPAASVVHVGACWGLAMFGGARDVPEEAKLAVYRLDRIAEPEERVAFGEGTDYLLEAKKTSDARAKLRGAIPKGAHPWWGTAELLSCLGNAAWLGAAGSAAAQAALGALRSLVDAEEAEAAILEVALAVLVSHLRNGRGRVLEVASAALAEWQPAGCSTVEIADIALAMLVDRLDDPWDSKHACAGIAAFRERALPHVAVLPGVLRKPDVDPGDLQRVAAAVGALCAAGVLPSSAADETANALQAHLSDPRPCARIFACRGLGALEAAAVPHQGALLQAVLDPEGLVAGAAAQVLCSMHAAGRLPDDLAETSAQRLAQRLRHPMEVEAMSLGSGVAPLVQGLLDRFGYRDIVLAVAPSTPGRSVMGSPMHSAAARARSIAFEDEVSAPPTSSLQLGRAKSAPERMRLVSVDETATWAEESGMTHSFDVPG